MPIVQVHLLEGRPKEVKQQLISEITAAVSRTLGNSPETIRVLLHDVSSENWGVAGSPISNNKKM
ncbi:2-hydroxymuconate tautomerase family protein [Neobacillus sp. PS2-9]|uniref:tautomerase family protein n=1 Tax=Neobacillus sp. PS2-9 TaxID=3070676 RepID=UPI0027DFCF2A|nr:2-hydroxymuconate tautomerase family protein [Neobacillus sp. PS2-9]WML56707.1 2-hydroxymuconate tautomerase family protein [Neobacillus sp. PS2-9]